MIDEAAKPTSASRRVRSSIGIFIIFHEGLRLHLCELRSWKRYELPNFRSFFGFTFTPTRA